MRGQLVNEYTKLCSDGVRRTFYVYKVTGKPSEIQEFIDSDSAKTTDAEGNHLWITSRYGGENVKLVVTKAKRVTFDQSEMRKIAALANMFGDAGKAVLSDYINSQIKGNSVRESGEISTEKEESDDIFKSDDIVDEL